MTFIKKDLGEFNYKTESKSQGIYQNSWNGNKESYQTLASKILMTIIEIELTLYKYWTK
jgi:hypothetical protein